MVVHRVGRLEVLRQTGTGHWRLGWLVGPALVARQRVVRLAVRVRVEAWHLSGNDDPVKRHHEQENRYQPSRDPPVVPC